MIPRYDKIEISSIWSSENKFKTYLDVELAAIKAQEGVNIPLGIAEQIQGKVNINIKRIEEIELEVHHDLSAFCTSITEQLPKDVGRFFHFGVTSSDIIDTATSLQVKASLKIIVEKLKELLSTLKECSLKYKYLITIGRSHGMYAEPLSFGQKFLGYYAEFQRRLEELEKFLKEELTGQFSGAVGNYTVITPEIEQRACEFLGLKVETLSTQVIPRDRLAKLINVNALLASAIERLATEIRHLHRSEVGEVHEGFSMGQKGSSIMPHKKNPISGENLTGMARVLRSHVSIALENIILWHERDISHSSSERLYLPDNLGLLYYSLDRLNNTVQRLVVHEEYIESKVWDNSLYLSSFYLHQILKKTSISREEVYKIIQEVSFESQGKDFEHYYIFLKKKLEGYKIALNEFEFVGVDQLKSLYLKHVDTIFDRVIDNS